MGSFSVNNDISLLNSINQLNFNNNNLNNTLNRLSTGMRINTGADDAAGLQIADSLRGNVMASDQSVRNVNDGISVLQIADGALGQINDLLHRAVTLAEEASSEMISDNGRAALDHEYQQILAEIDRIGESTNFNGTALFSDKFGNSGPTDGLDVFAGDLFSQGASSYISASTGSISAENLGLSSNLLTTEGSANALGEIKEALNTTDSMRGEIGASMNRLQSAVNVNSAKSQNTLSAGSAIRDANMAEEITNMAKSQLLIQAGIAALAHSNANSQNMLRLLQ